LLQAHNQKLDQAGFKASAITDDLGRAAAAAKLWSETLSVERWTQWLADWGIRGTGGVVFSVAGYISCPTLDPITMVVRTIVLFFGGKKIFSNFLCNLANFSQALQRAKALFKSDTSGHQPGSKDSSHRLDYSIATPPSQRLPLRNTPRWSPSSSKPDKLLSLTWHDSKTLTSSSVLGNMIHHPSSSNLDRRGNFSVFHGIGTKYCYFSTSWIFGTYGVDQTILAWGKVHSHQKEADDDATAMMKQERYIVICEAALLAFDDGIGGTDPLRIEIGTGALQNGSSYCEDLDQEMTK
jgi:hypothetical protein